jgi:hypothetical protein
VNYFVPLAHTKRIPLSREQVWKSLQGHRHLACTARKRILKCQISEDAQVEQDKSSTRNTRIRGGQNICQKDVSYWEHRQIFQLAFGSFHLAMNLLWCVLETHWGTITQTGSLTHLFAVLEKTRLGGEQPDYHTLLSALTQVLHGLILNAWLTKCNCSSLADFARAEPMPRDLLEVAHCIIEKYTVPEPVFESINPKAPPKDLHSDVPFSHLKPVVDVVHNNVVLLTRDLLYMAELVDAIATGDFGWVEDILPTLVCMFRGSGSNNYSMEILHLIFNIKEVWTPAFVYVILCSAHVRVRDS